MKMWEYLRDYIINTFKEQIQRLSIRWKIFFSFLILFLLIILATNILIISYQKKSLKNQIHTNLSLLFENLTKDVIDNLIFFDPLAIDEKISLVMNNPGIEYIMIVDKNGKVVGHSNKRFLGDNILDLSFEKKRTVDNEGILHINLPIVSGDTYFGILRAGISENKISYFIDQSIKNLRRYLYVVNLFSFIITLFLSFLLSKTLIKPLQRLKEKMLSIRADKLEICENPKILLCKDFLKCDQVECPAYGKQRCWLIKEAKENCKQSHNIDCKSCEVYKISCGDEIGYLIESFNEMIIKLKDSIEELDRTTKEKLKLEKSSAIAEMAMIVAHEIKNPLNSIRASTSYLKTTFQGEVLKEFLTIIDRETERLNELISSFLSYARPVPLKYEKGDINQVIKDVIKLVDTEIKDEKKVLQIYLDESIPQFYFDHHQIKQAILNLLINANDATEQGDTITVKTEREIDKVKIFIKDTGVGIPKEHIDKIFEPFFTTKTTGSGLGLACVERIIKEHKGTIRVSSKENEGTEFIIELPLNG